MLLCPMYWCDYEYGVNILTILPARYSDSDNDEKMNNLILLQPDGSWIPYWPEQGMTNDVPWAYNKNSDNHYDNETANSAEKESRHRHSGEKKR